MSKIKKKTGVTTDNFELELSKLVRFLEKIDCECGMRDVISILCFSLNKYGIKSESIYDKDHIHKCANLSISQNFIACFYHNLHFLSQNMYQKNIKIGKCKTFLDIQRNVTLKMFIYQAEETLNNV